MEGKSLVVIGGGAAGFFCAVNAARMHPGLAVTILEKSNKLLAKVRVSGGGRCNVTHACFDIVEMSRHYPRGMNFVKKTFHQFFTTDTIEWFAERGVRLKTEADGRMFPATNTSETIVQCLLQEADKFGVKVHMQWDVKQLEKTGAQWSITDAGGRNMVADFVCVACGGYPKKEQFDWLVKLGHTIEEPVPSLFTFNMPGNPVTELMGVSVERVRVKIAGSKLESEGPLLITHWGMSGPAILKLSAWGARELKDKNYTFTAIVNWLPDMKEPGLRQRFQELRLEHAAQRVGTRSPFGLPQRLWEYLLGRTGIKTDIRWADLPAKAQNQLVQLLLAGEFAVQGKTTFKEEFVTAGGVKLSEIDHQTMGSKRVGGLYFAGEAMDVDAVTGGFNFQHAWTSGYIVAKGLGVPNTTS